jgi:hydroxylamine reductase (hybrid-cluster protein)
MAKRNFTLKDYYKNEAKNYHAENALELVKKYGTKAEIKKIEAINKRHMERGHLVYDDLVERDEVALKYHKNLVDEAESKKKKRKGDRLI